MYYTQNKYTETKTRFSRLLRHPAWKRRGSILVSALHKFVTYFLLRHLPTCLQPRTHTGRIQRYTDGHTRPTDFCAWPLR